MSNRLLIIDGSALLYRGHYAYARNPLYNGHGMNVSGLYMFTRSILKALDELRPSHAVVALDPFGKTARHVEYPAYKANRPSPPAAITESKPWIPLILEGLNIPLAILVGYEADDVMATLACQAPVGTEVLIMTPDKDMAQLVDADISLYRTGTKVGRNYSEIIDQESVRSYYGVNPDQIPDWLGLQGDVSDNIPGVPRIGRKTAVALLNRFSDIEDILANTHKISQQVLRASLEEHAESARLSRRLATLICDLDVGLFFEDLERMPPNYIKHRDVCRELNITNLVNLAASWI
jgi:DNA polymerase I